MEKINSINDDSLIINKQNKFFIITIGQVGLTFEMNTTFSHENFSSDLATRYSKDGYILEKNSKGAYFIIKDFSAIVIFNEEQYREHAVEQSRQAAAQRFNPRG